MSSMGYIDALPGRYKMQYTVTVFLLESAGLHPSSSGTALQVKEALPACTQLVISQVSAQSRRCLRTFTAGHHNHRSGGTCCTTCFFGACDDAIRMIDCMPASPAEAVACKPQLPASRGLYVCTHVAQHKLLSSMHIRISPLLLTGSTILRHWCLICRFLSPAGRSIELQPP